MAYFEINDKEYELKLTYSAIKYLNSQVDGGAFGVLGNAIGGDIEFFPKIVHAALFHTGEKFTLKTVEKEIEKLIDNEELSMEDISKICDEVVTQSFFYKATVAKMMKKNPEMKQALDQLRD